MQASRVIPLSISTPYGPASGSLQTAGLLSKPAVAALAKGLAKSLPFISVGTALYDAYQASGIVLDPNGQPVTSTPVSIWSNPSFGTATYTDPGAACGSRTGLGAACVISSQTATTLTCKNSYDGTVCGTFSVTGTAPGASVPATQTQTDAAIDAAINSDINMAIRLSQQAWDAGQTFPNMSVIQSVPHQSFETNWYQTAAYLDVLNNATITEAKAVISFDPAQVATINDPIPMTVTENKRTTTNGTQTGSSSSTLVSQSPGNTSATAPQSPLQPQNQTDCDKNPNSIGCSAFGEADIPDSPLGNLSQSVSFTPVNLGGSGSCPAPRTFNAAGHAFSIPYDKICTFQIQSKPLVLAACALIGAFIFVGGMKVG